MNEIENLVAFELIESSDSSSDEKYLIPSLFFNLNRPVRHPVPKIHNFIENVVTRYTDDQFKGAFRLSRTTSDYFVQRYEQSDFYNEDGDPEAKKSAEMHILSFLWYAGNKSTLRSVGERFEAAISTVHAIMENVMDFLLSIAPSVIVWPETDAQKDLIADKFEEISGINGVVGCIDRCLINIRTPANTLKSTYINRHDGTSMTLQGICDSNFKFIDCFTGPPSRIHDARIFRMSFIYPIVHQMDENYHLLGDCGYGISKNVITPFREYHNLSLEKRNFNTKLSQTRGKIENAFGFLKARFRQLVRIDFHTPEKDAKFIICCCVLHNLCIEHDDFLWDLPDCDPHYDPNNGPVDLNPRRGDLKRRIITRSLL